METIEVITLHHVTNFGSLLQTYATEQILRRQGYDVKIIDFVPEGLSFKRAVWPKGGKIIRKIIKIFPLLFCNLFQFYMVDAFLKHYVTLTDERYRNYFELSARKLEADIYISGSDQVWNTQNNNSEEDLGAYYLAFAQQKPRIAYAGSFGKNDFSENEKKRIMVWLTQYTAISVREDTGLQILSELGLEGTHVVDPTFLLTKREWIDFCKKERKTSPQSGYIFVYNLNRNKLIEKIAKLISGRYGLRIVNFADTFEFIKGADNRLFNTPFDFLNYLVNAEYVITDSFHGTSFSLNMEKQFIVVAAPKYNSRIESVLRMAHCEDRIVTSADDALNLCENKIDYNRVSCDINQQREYSMKFLERAIDECKYYRK